MSRGAGGAGDEGRQLRLLTPDAKSSCVTRGEAARPVHLTITMIKWIRASRLGTHPRVLRLVPRHVRQRPRLG